MLIAEIRRKLGDLDDLDLEASDPLEALRAFLSSRKEDILTADVFGTLKYLPRDPYWKHVLHGIRQKNPHSASFDRCLAEQRFGETDFEFKFWPGYRTPAGIEGQRTEPDVEIVSERMRLFVEAKLHSDFGDLQIVRQLLIGLADTTPGREFFLLLVTKGFRAPRIRLGGEKLELPEYLRRVGQTLSISAEQRERLAAASERVLWINWRTIGRLLQRCHHDLPPQQRDRSSGDLIADLQQLLALRSMGPMQGLPATLPDVGRDRPVIADFLGGRRARKRRSFHLADAVARFVDSNVSFRSPQSGRRPRFGTADVLVRSATPQATGWKIRLNESQPAGKFKMNLAALAARHPVSIGQAALWTLRTPPCRFNFAKVVDGVQPTPSVPLLLRSHHE